jgi:ABC-type multidrug transport system fused ATPase/permease subunit
MKKYIHFFKMVWKVCPSYVVLMVVNAVTSGARLFLNVILPKYLVDEFIGDKNPKVLLFFGVCIVLNNVGMNFLSNTWECLMAKKEAYTRNAMRKIMAEKIMNLEYSYLEDPYYLDLKERAVFAIGNQDAIAQTIQCAAAVFTGLVTLTGLFAILSGLGLALFVVLAAGCALDLLIYAGFSKTMVKMTNEVIPINRRFGYYLGLGFERNMQKDIRLYDMEEMLENRLLTYTDATCDMMEDIEKKSGAVMGGMGIVNDAVAAICYGYVGIRTISDAFGSKISLGSLTMYVSAAIQFSQLIMNFGQSVVQLGQCMSFLNPYMEFMGLKEETARTGKEIFEGPVESIEFRDVTFTYPKAEKPVLRNISFLINRGEKISIVGLNGAGKSTLVKLICRMYRADSGTILVNGKNIYDYDYLSYMKCVAAVFQDYRLFNFTIAENISCQEKNADTEKIDRLIDEVGLRQKIDSLKDGVMSRFGKEYDENGIEMSGGEGQKVAIARALYKDSSMVILDEPASALDPIAEAEIYEKFNGLVEDKTAIYISHRMSSSVFCDRILIIDGGTVADFDTHENLMKKTDSLYYKLFHSQAENYKLESVKPEEVCPAGLSA